MPQIEFFGGPKDGDVYFVVGQPAEIFLFMDGTLDIVALEYIDHPKRSIEYHKYVLEESKYIYCGLV